MQTWPLYGVRIHTERLELRLPDLALLDELAQLAARGIHEPERMPFGNAWTDKRPPELERSVVQFGLLQVATWSPSKWTFNPVVIHDGRVIGTQDMEADGFANSRSFSTGSWLGREYQGRGFGREMRAAILHLGFEGLGAEEALTSAFSDNPASQAVSRSLGYEPNGQWRAARRGAAATHLSFRLTRQRWLAVSRPKVELQGLAPCRDLFGL